jgi:uncharacterized membrane protein (UPF0127 family)
MMVTACIVPSEMETPSPTPSPRPDDSSQALTVAIRIGDDEFETEIASTPTELSTGLMNRSPDDFPIGRAMLFILGRTQFVSVWNANVLFDIDVAFIAADGEIKEIIRLEAGNLFPRQSSEPVDFFLEVNAGEFSDRSITVGDTVELPEAIR